MKTMANRQRGVSLSGLLAVLVLVIVGLIAGMKLVPAYMEDASIKSALIAVASDPAMKNAKDGDIRTAYGKRAQVANITAIRPDDVDINRENGLSLSATYTVKVPLVANISLVLDFSPNSTVTY